MKDELRKAMLVALGLVVVTKEKINELTSELIKKGEISEKDARKLVNKVVSEIDKTRVKVERKIKKEINRIAKEVDKATRAKTKPSGKKKA